MKIPIFACTANTEDDSKCMEAKMAGVLHKPVTKEELEQLLLKLSETLQKKVNNFFNS